MLSLKDFESKLASIDKTKLGSIYGGAGPTDGGTKTLMPGTEHEYTIEYSTDWETESGSTILNECVNGNDVLCDGVAIPDTIQA
ncbi:MAG: hypothetical protein EA362_00105 [Saprospirales bacterium]|nr:MAG: hypothetical protein EA362_00105 [Saprospirales bacterium]